MERKAGRTASEEQKLGKSTNVFGTVYVVDFEDALPSDERMDENVRLEPEPR
jgi:hypothetical protein